MLKAYFDASERQSGTFCVAGYAFTKRQVKKFDKEWSALFGRYGGCHMKELTSRTGRFKGITQTESDRLLVNAIKIINRRISYGAVISCQMQEVGALLPRWITGFQHAYPVCCHLVMTAMGMFVSKQGTQRVAYHFESGDRYSGVAHAFMARTEDTPELKESYRHVSHAFIPKSSAMALQAADVLAWEWAKFRDETLNRRVRKMRLSLINLLGPDGKFKSTQYTGFHITGEPLQRFFAQVWQLGLLQLEEEKAK